MNQRTRRTLAHAARLAPAVVVCALWLPPGADAALSPSAYEVGALCPAPTPGYAACLGLRLLAKQPLAVRGARARTPRSAGAAPSGTPAPAASSVPAVEYNEPWGGSLTPQNVLTAYALSAVPAPATQQTLALVDAYNDPTAEHDLKVFDERFSLAACTTGNGCFTKIEMQGGSPKTAPPTEPGWAEEIATDVEVAHGLCPSCRILLVEAHSNSNSDLKAAEKEAESRGATEISNSWGGLEVGMTSAEDELGPFNHPGTVITASSGDDGYLSWDAANSFEKGYAEYPAASPHVVAVGGTRLNLGTGGAWASETVWNGDGAGGGGCSTIFEAPLWQQGVAGFAAVGCGSKRAVADVSADADPYTGVAVYDSTPVEEGGSQRSGWVTIGGTSVASPIIASTFALAGGAGKATGGEAVSYPAQTLYQNLASAPGSLHDVVSGSNGKCSKAFNGSTGESGCSAAEEDASCSPKLVCLAGTGYDGPTGVGSPHGIGAFVPGSEEGKSEGQGSKGSGKEEAKSEGEGSKGAGVEEGQSGGGQSAEGTGTGTGTGTGVGGTTVNGPPSVSAITASTLTGAGALAPMLSALSLTHSAVVALSRSRPKASRLGFAFTISATARVHVTLAKRVRLRGHTRWQLLPDSLTLAARTGRNSRRLHGGNALTAGSYRLTLTTAFGTARSLSFRIS